MNFQPASFKALHKSNVCFYIVLNVEGIINFANDYFQNSFCVGALPFSSIYSLADPQQAEHLSGTINGVLSNPELQKTINLNLHKPGGNYIATRWDITAGKADQEIFLQCIGIPIPENEAEAEVADLLSTAFPYEEIFKVFPKDITEKKKTEETVRLSMERYEVLAKATKDAIWDWNLTTGKVVWNDGLQTIFCYAGDEKVKDSDWWVRNIYPEDRDRVLIKMREHISERLPNWQDEYRFRCADGSYKYVFDRGFTIYDNNKLPVRMIGSMQDLTETKANELNLKDLNKSLQKRAAELAASNEELERFAYVASHDLQEPLRMVSSFLQLIEKKYKDKLDQKAHEYIAFAVDGAERMKGLILDLLEYSRVNTSKAAKEVVDLNEIAQNILALYNPAIEQANGTIIIDNLPVVVGNKVQLMQLFQNLAGNALKHKSDLPPKIFVRVKENENNHEFSIVDNGIGIESRFFEKIFVIFQRLHNKNEYSGTGIGLAICKKIIELHAGSIWVESTPGKGSTFFFTLPKANETADKYHFVGG